MKIFRPSQRRLLDRAQRRFIRSRPGSVLILVVALLVLMALIGTAYVSMAQSDRYAAEQHRANVQVDMLVDSVVDTAKNTVVSSLFSNNAFRPSTWTFDQTTGIGMDTQALNVLAAALPPGSILPSTGDPWLADRLPSVLNPFTAANFNPNGNPPFWQYITAPLTGTHFDTPYWPGGPGAPVYYTRDLPASVPLANGGGMNARMVPVWVNLPSGTYPALQMMDYRSPPQSVSPAILAADADGEGIADSGLVKLPVGTIDGVTYYYGARIIDNGAAINANTAWTPNPYVTTPSISGMPGDFFPVNVDLQGLLVRSGELYSAVSPSTSYLNLYRYGSAYPQGSVANPVDENDLQRTDYRYMPFSPSAAGYYFDQVWMQFGRRLQNPGRLVANGPNFQALGITDSMALAYKFCLYDPSLAQSAIEQALPISTGRTGYLPLRPEPYPSNDPLDWFNQNFLYGPDSLRNQAANQVNNNVANNMPLRPVLVARNPVSNFCPVKFRDRGIWTLAAASSAEPYQFGDSVTDGTHRWVCIAPGTTVQPLLPPAVNAPQGNEISPDDLNPTVQAGWVYVPWRTAPTKVDVNTASFGELWLAYWSVMCEQNPGSPNALPASTWPLRSAMPVLPYPAPDFNNTSPDWRMFRSPIRSTTLKLHPYQVMLLRAAIAAVNTIDLRDNDDDVTSRTITLPAMPASVYRATAAVISVPAAPAYNVTIYGTEMQPYITEVYANNNSSPTSGGYVAIELHNPYPRPIALKGFRLATLDRTSLALTEISTSANTQWSNAIIPANGYLVVVSDSGVTALPPGTRAMTATNPVVIPALADSTSGVFNKELVLLRPRRSCLSTPLNPPNGTLSKSVYPTAATSSNPNPPRDPMNNYDEGTTGAPLLYNFVPVDSYDFTGLTTPPVAGTNPTEWHYVRFSGTAGNKAWHCTYPGRYYSKYAPDLLDPRQEGTMAGPLGATIMIAGAPSLASFGAPDNLPLAGGVNAPNAPHPQQDVALQLNNSDAAGPNNPTHGEPSAYPFGGFMRNGDILQVPFIGAYKISPITNPAQILELNSVSMDAAMATVDNDLEFHGTPPISVITQGMTGGPSVPVVENVGRFCPIDIADVVVGAPVPGAPNDFAPYIPQNLDPTVDNPLGLNAQWRYHFATRLFDYLTVQSPQSDYTPEVDPYVDGIKYETGTPTLIAKYPGVGVGTGTFPQPVANVTPQIRNAETNNLAGADEETAPIDGLVNVNTANWRVLAAVPWVPWDYGTGTYPPTITTMTTRGMAQLAIAYSIVRYRDYDDNNPAAGRPPHGHGPFRNLFELGRVPLYNPTTGVALGIRLKDALGPSTLLTSHFDYKSGNLSPADGSSDNVFNDFESQYLTINRISNLVTTRSDSFTVYLIVQGWRNAETANPTLVVQRRAAFIVDRSGVTPLSKSPNVVPVPTD